VLKIGFLVHNLIYTFRLRELFLLELSRTNRKYRKAGDCDFVVDENFKFVVRFFVIGSWLEFFFVSLLAGVFRSLYAESNV